MNRSTDDTTVPEPLLKEEDNIAIVLPEIEKGQKSDKDVQNDPFLIAFNPQYDSENPKDWPTKKKWIVTTVLSSTGFNRIMVSTIMAPALTTIAQEFHMSDVESVMSMSVYLLATAFGPLLMGPLSELYGRKPVLHASNIWFLIWNLICGFSNSKGLLIASRLLAGFGASAIYALQGGVLGDLWRPEQRGKSIAIYTIIPLLAPACGPILGGYIAEYTTWRWMFWSTSALQGAMVLVSLFTYHESHAPTILHKRAQKIRRESGDDRYYTATERMDVGRSVAQVLSWNLTRPVRLLIFHPIIQIFALYSGFSYGVLYLVISTYSTLWVKQYHETVATSGLHYIAAAGGEIAGAQIGGPLMDITFRKLKERAGGAIAPEYRVPLIIPGIFIIAMGFLCYGWTAHFRAYWVAVDVGVFIVDFGLSIASNSMQAYVIDAYPHHTSSASAAAQVFRSLTAFSFPLFAPQMYSALGYGWGNSTVAFVTLAIGLTAPMLIWRYGAGLRARQRPSY